MFLRSASLLFIWLLASLHLVAADENADASIQRLLKQHCVACHGLDGEINGDVDLQALSEAESLTTDLDLLGDLIQVIDQREMPPEDEPQLSAAQRNRMLSMLRRQLEHSVSQQRRLAHTPIRRMNRFQYNNAVTDLFELDCVVFTLPERMMREHRNYFRPHTGVMADTVTVGSRPLGKSQLIESRLGGVAPFPQDLRAEHGFDNRGDHLSLSPLLMESFLQLSQSIVQSPDFSPRHVAIWDQFFAAPAAQDDRDETVRQRLDWFLTRAFRRPVDEQTRSRYVSYAIARLDRGADFTDTMKSVAAAAIASPKFLYLYQTSSTGDSVQPLGDLELASRLSFFLWGSIPDSELLQLAAAEKLNDPEVLAGQVDRMLHDHKLKRFCDSFPAQWLQLERIISSLPDPERFPDFYFSKYRRSMHMMIEPLLLFETVLIENQPITQFIDSDFTYRSRLLREAYGEHLSASELSKRGGGEVGVLTFDRLANHDRRYGGMITNAAVLTMTSAADRTKPITRGAWLASVIFNDPPDPPPADVPPLAEEPAQGEENLSLRERLTLHRQRQDCRGCHEQIDPLGFALENFNPVGQWRQHYDNGAEIDASGQLFRQHSFTSVIEFKQAVMAEKDRFSEGFVGHVLSFALARQLDAADTLAVKQIAAATAADDYRIQTLIHQIVLSDPFRHKSNVLSSTDAQH